MPNNHFAVEVVAADRRLFSGDAVSLVAPGIDGYFGVLRGHAPLIAALAVGEITITLAHNQPPKIIAVSGGFIEVKADHVMVLADTAELAEEIDIVRARLALERAERFLKEADENVDIDRAQAALMRAINRLRVAGQTGI